MMPLPRLGVVDPRLRNAKADLVLWAIDFFEVRGNRSVHKLAQRSQLGVV